MHFRLESVKEGGVESRANRIAAVGVVLGLGLVVSGVLSLAWGEILVGCGGCRRTLKVPRTVVTN